MATEILHCAQRTHRINIYLYLCRYAFSIFNTNKHEPLYWIFYYYYLIYLFMPLHKSTSSAHGCRHSKYMRELCRHLSTQMPNTIKGWEQRTTTCWPAAGRWDARTAVVITMCRAPFRRDTIIHLHYCYLLNIMYDYATNASIVFISVGSMCEARLLLLLLLLASKNKIESTAACILDPFRHWIRILKFI